MNSPSPNDVSAVSTDNTMPKASMRKLLSRVRCPHCWHVFPAQDVLWVSEHDDLRGDPVLGADHPTRFLPSRFNAKGQALDARGIACHDNACPRCHQLLPSELLTHQPLIFSTIGLPFSGKSYYLTSLSWSLRRSLPTRFGIIFSDVNPSENQVLLDYEQALFHPPSADAMVALPKTQVSDEHYADVRVDDQQMTLAHPFMFRLRLTSDHPNAARAKDFSQIVCLYDNAGEHFLPGAKVSGGTDHLVHSRVLMFMFDPIQDPGIRKQAQAISQDPQLHDDKPFHRQDTVVSEMALRVRRHLGLEPHEKLGKPLIVVLTKSDVWGPLIDEDLVSEPYQEYKVNDRTMFAVDIERIERVSKVLRDFLMERVPEFVVAVEDACDPVTFIPVSALGTSPERSEGDENGELQVRSQTIEPHWVPAPMLYSYAKWSTGLVKAVGG